MTRYLTREEACELHRRGLKLFGGMPGLRDDGLLDSALAQPQAAFGGLEIYVTLPAKAAALAFSLINNHSFVDGNKRVGFAAMAVFLELNSNKLVCTADEGEAAIRSSRNWENGSRTTGGMDRIQASQQVTCLATSRSCELELPTMPPPFRYL